MHAAVAELEPQLGPVAGTGEVLHPDGAQLMVLPGATPSTSWHCCGTRRSTAAGCIASRHRTTATRASRSATLIVGERTGSRRLAPPTVAGFRGLGQDVPGHRSRFASRALSNDSLSHSPSRRPPVRHFTRCRVTLPSLPVASRWSPCPCPPVQGRHRPARSCPVRACTSATRIRPRVYEDPHNSASDDPRCPAGNTSQETIKAAHPCFRRSTALYLWCPRGDLINKPWHRCHKASVFMC
ncbi:hypothetical protein EDD30_0896 [Couchioplanes caeruleus]|uniref:Uncharacterized protein n=1 Tax=Couchioplanes caeruleus TaxID=56438 RepID=A0A3N1GDD4_9ACTN|nr:hypothetical protein EDD30_0896 [Couchioplanes caeruleus]